ncbi:MAG: peptidase [Acidobacteria bacterium]|nr:peptidase [Acidobacteriota bacterium]
MAKIRAAVQKPAYETYVASAKVAARKLGTAAAATAYKIEVRFLGGLTTAQKNAFKSAADRWTRVIVGDLPSVRVDGEVVDDLLILAQGVAIDGPGGVLGQAGPTHLRPASAGKTAFLPVKGIMSFDTADLAKMQQDGTLKDVITHEMGHVIGVGTIWALKGKVKGAGTANPRFTGAAAKAEFGKLKAAGAAEVPVENSGGAGTRDGHWRETVFRTELMSGFIAAPNTPLSRMTVASLKDLGYTVDLARAEPYRLPDLFAVAAAGAGSTHDRPHALPIVPITLPDSSLIP